MRHTRNRYLNRFIAPAMLGFGVSACSLFLGIDDEGYVKIPGAGGGSGGGFGGDGSGGLLGSGGQNASGGEEPMGGMGGERVDGTGGVVTSGGSPGVGGTGGGGGTGSTSGTGGQFNPLEDAKHYYGLNETSGDIAEDSGGAEAHLKGVVSHSSSWSTGLTNGGYEIMEDLYFLQLDETILPTKEFSISWWFNRALESDQLRVLVQKTASDNQSGFSLLDGPTGLVLHHGADWANASIPTETFLPSPTQGKWVHFVISYHRNADGNMDRLRLWVDAVKAGEKTAILQSSNQLPETTDGPLRFGRSYNNANPPMPGLLDEVRIYDRELTEDEVWQLYENDRELE
jgi:hypothetical protein